MHHLDRRTFIKVLGCSALAVGLENLLTGCGGGGSGSSSGTKAIIKPNVVPIPSDGSVTVVNASESQIVLQGSVPTIANGSVIVSGLGNGIIAKATAVTTTGSTTNIQVAGATLEDVFQSGSVSLKKDLQYADLATVTPILNGVTVTAPTGAGIGRSVLNLNKGFDLDFGNVEVSGGIAVTGSANVQFHLNDSIVIDSSGVESVTFIPSVTVTGTLTITGNISVEASDKVRYLHIVGEPQVVVVDFVPVVFLPVFDFYFLYSAKLAGTASFTASVSTTVAAGLRYTRGGGWTQVKSSPTTTSSFQPADSFTAELTVTPVHIEFSELIYGVAGPTAFVDLPTLDAEFTINPPTHAVPGYELGCNATFDLSAGYTVQVLGKTLADSPVTGSLSAEAKIFNQFYPDSNITVNSVKAGGRK